ncbi:MAG: glycosyltransferase family 39 protein [Gemmataceae bacterium]
MGIRVVITGYVFLAVLFLAWPTYRTFLRIEIDVNESWNAYFADAAMGQFPLYPPRDQFITNNYPPLSFYLVGTLGKLSGDSILAGRLLSLAAVLIIGVGTYFSLKELSTDSLSALIGACFFIVTLGRFFTSYVGMNDPQLLAQAVMTWGFVLFLRSQRLQRAVYPAIAVMVLAGFIKHNLIVIPIACLITVGRQRPRVMLQSTLFAGALIALGFLICYFTYGSDFFANLFCPRVSSWRTAFTSIGHLQWVAVGLVFWCFTGNVLRNDPAIQLVNRLILLGITSFLLQKTGDGVSYNAQFELVFAVALGVGLTFSRAEPLSQKGRFTPGAIRLSLVLAITLRLLASGRMEPARLFYDRNFHAEIALREQVMQQTIDRIRLIPNALGQTTNACYYARLPFVFDSFSTSQRVQKGQLTAEAVKSWLENPPRVVVFEDPLVRWSRR